MDTRSISKTEALELLTSGSKSFGRIEKQEDRDTVIENTLGIFKSAGVAKRFFLDFPLNTIENNLVVYTLKCLVEAGLLEQYFMLTCEVCSTLRILRKTPIIRCVKCSVDMSEYGPEKQIPYFKIKDKL